ncbi:MAG: GGDEF domain-containing protein [Bacilli bacterium]
MIADMRRLRAVDFLYLGRWVLVLIVPCVSAAAHIASTGYAVIEGILLLCAFAVSITAKYRPLPDICWASLVSLDVLLVTAMIALAQPSLTYVWPLYLWCVIEASLALRSKAGFTVTMAVDLISLLFIVPFREQQETFGQVSARLLVFNMEAFPILFSVYWERRHRRELAFQTEESTRHFLKVSELEHINRQMTDYTMDVQNRAVIDQLTGLYNQTYFHHRLLIEVEKSRQNHELISLILCDIDHFKQFNDQFGHYLGDDVLRSVAKVLLDMVTDQSAVAARLGGEEFVLAMPNTETAAACEFAEKLRRLIADTVVSGPVGALRVTISAGVATFPGTAKDALELVKLADKAMYTAKDMGRNRVCCESSPAAAPVRLQDA